MKYSSYISMEHASKGNVPYNKGYIQEMRLCDQSKLACAAATTTVEQTEVGF